MMHPQRPKAATCTDVAYPQHPQALWRRWDL